MKTGLLLTGGGARAAYQVGVLHAISHILKPLENPFNIISGVSAGALNGVWISTQADRFEVMTKTMWDGWASIKMEDIFKTDPLSFVKIGTNWLSDFKIKNWSEHIKFTSLLNSKPLETFLKSKFDFSMIKKNIESKKIHGVSVTTTNYNSGSSVIFFDGDPSIESWGKDWLRTRRVHLNLHHIMASASIPIFFPPVQLDDGFYGDGGVKLSSPLSPLIHMGAERILAIGIHHKEEVNIQKGGQLPLNISLGDVAGTLLNALFFHSIDMDIERFLRINRTLSIMTPEQLEKEPDRLRHISLLSIQPSEDLGQVESELYERFPRTLRLLLHGLGASSFESSDLMSYLSFENQYIMKLMKLGYLDGIAREEEIKNFFSEN